MQRARNEYTLTLTCPQPFARKTLFFTAPESLVFRSLHHSLGDHRLHLAVGPENGPPLVLLHGVLRRWTDWSPLLDVLAARWQVIGVDLRGHGQSDRTPGNYLVVDYVRDIVRLMGQVADEPVMLVGHSLGAMVALAAAAEAPAAVRAVVAEDPPFHTMGDRIAESQLLDYFRALHRLHLQDKPVAKLTRALADVPVRSPDGTTMQRLGDLRDLASLRFAAACLKQVAHDVLEPIVAGRWLAGYDVPQVLGRLQCPVLLLQADAAAGGMLTDDDAALAERTAAECYRERFLGVGHLIHWTDTPGMTRRTLAFLESQRAATDTAGPRVGGGPSADKTHRIDGHETRTRHDSHQKRPVG